MDSFSLIIATLLVADKSSRHDAVLFKCLACDFNHTLESHLELGFATYHAPATQVPVLEISTVETPCASSWYPSQCHGKIRVKINHSMILGRSTDTDGQFDHTAVLGTKATVRGYDKVSNFSRFDVEPEYNVTMSRVESIEGFVFILHFTYPGLNVPFPKAGSNIFVIETATQVRRSVSVKKLISYELTNIIVNSSHSVLELVMLTLSVVTNTWATDYYNQCVHSKIGWNL